MTGNALDRRTAMKLAASAAIAPALAGSLASTANATAQMLGISAPTHQRFKLGNFELTALNDGTVQREGPFPTFGQNQPEADVKAFAKANFLPADKFETGFSPMVVNTGTNLILFDTGNGNLPRPNVGKLITNLKTAGYQPEDIDIVALTHCHPDHIAGLMADGKPLFPNARYVIGEKEYDFWSPIEKTEDKKTARVGKLMQSQVVPLAEKMTMLKDEGEVVSGIHAIACHGHTPGHMAYHFESNGKRFLLWGDITNHYVMSLQRPDWHVKFDFDKEMAAKTRRRILDMAATEKMPVSGYHMPFPTVGFVEKKDSAYRWVPASYQLNL